MTLELFEKMVERLPWSGCWLWLGSIQKRGYAQIADKRGGRFIPTTGHRWIWERTRGKVPDGFMVCHRCDVRSCVNPDHLFPGTAKDNTQDMMRKGRADISGFGKNVRRNAMGQWERAI